MKKAIITGIILSISFSINAQNWFNSKRIKGNGKVITESRTTSDYSAISVTGFFDVVLVKGKEGQIIIEGEQNIIGYIITEVSDNNTLKIKFKKHVRSISTRKKLEITVPYEDISKIYLVGSGDIIGKEKIKADDISLKLAGSGDIKLDIDANEINSSVTGSGNIKIMGTTTDFTCSVSGSGDISAYDLKAVSVYANIVGSGTIKITTSNKIKARVSGSGDIYYKGKPKYVDSKSIGSGDIISRD